ncbi:MAG: signal recognition particle-docking protein FtsY [Roseibium sp.]
MSEKKRGFLGRIFGGKDKPEKQEDVVVDPASEEAVEQVIEEPVEVAIESEQDADTAIETVEMDVEPVAAMSAPAEPFDIGSGPDLTPELQQSMPSLETEENLSADLGADVEAEPASSELVEVDPVPTPDPSATLKPMAAEDEPKGTWFQRLKQGLSRSSSALTDGISSIFTKRKLDAAMLEELEDILIQADLGVDTAMAITERLSDGRYDKEISPDEVREILSEEVEKVLAPVAQELVLDPAKKPHVVLMVGVNGTGKTTTIGKLSQKLRAEGKTVMLAAGDTFRAAAVEQLKIWGERTGAEVIAGNTGADAAGLTFDAMKAATEKDVDVLLIDTAGRLQNKTELMEELEKVIRVIKKHDPEAPHTVLLTLDATTGQNALNQVAIFGKVSGVTGLVMTKLDGTARGGILVAIAAKHGMPVHFIGVGEGVADLEPFSAKDFASAIAGLA